MGESFIEVDMMIVANQQTAKVAQPGKGALDLPSLAVTPHYSGIVERRLFASLFLPRGSRYSRQCHLAPCWLRNQSVGRHGKNGERAGSRTPLGAVPQRRYQRY